MRLLFVLLIVFLNFSAEASSVHRAFMVTLSPDARGHYITQARINGRSVDVLVDTGASAVAFTYEDGMRLNLVTAGTKFDVPVNTGNGTVMYKMVKVDRIDLGPSVSVQNVEALVAPKGSLKANLLGMSFLRKLKKFEIRDGKLILND